MVLLLVLVIVALLTSLLTEFAFSTLVDLRLTETFRDSTRAYYLAKGGVRVGRIILREDKNGYDAYNDPAELWSQGLSNFPVGDGFVTVVVEDLGGKLDINGLLLGTTADNVVKERFNRLFDNLGLPVPEDLTAALIDWIDTDPDTYDKTGLGAEEDYYLQLEKPYAPKNGPLDSLEELALVRGFTPDVIRLITPHITVHGESKDQKKKYMVNVNTASAEVLISLAEDMDRETAEGIIAFRDIEPIRDAAKFNEVPGLDKILYAHLRVDSPSFRIKSWAGVGDGARTVEAVVKKTSTGKTELLYLKVN